MRLVLSLTLSFFLFLLFPSLSSLSFLFLVPVANLVKKERIILSLWTLLLLSIAQESVMSPSAESRSLPLLLILSLMTYFYISSIISLQGIAIEIGAIIALSIGFLIYKIFLVEAPLGIEYISFIFTSLLVSLSLYVGITFTSWIVEAGAKKIFLRRSRC